MFGFNFGNKIYLGIDIGSSAIKIVELTIKNEKPFLMNYAWMPYDRSVHGSKSEIITLIPECIRKMVKEAGLKGKNAYFSVPAYEGLITLIDFPRLPKEEMDQAVRFEAQKYIPTSLDDVALSWSIMNHDELANGEAAETKNVNKVLLIAVSKEKIAEYETIAKASDINLSGIEIETVSIANSLIGNDKGNFIIADIGCHDCNIILIEKGIIKLNRNINAGGADLTKSLAKGMNIAEERAEAVKLSNKNFFASDSMVHFSTIDLIAGEMARILEAYKKDQNSSPDAIILSGGTAELNGLLGFFETKFGIKTILGNPFGRITYDKRYEPAINNIKSRFSVSAGLALVAMENSLQKK